MCKVIKLTNPVEEEFSKAMASESLIRDSLALYGVKSLKELKEKISLELNVNN